VFCAVLLAGGSGEQLAVIKTLMADRSEPV
jgi:hypothetical protein